MSKNIFLPLRKNKLKLLCEFILCSGIMAMIMNTTNSQFSRECRERRNLPHFDKLQTTEAL